MADKLRVYVDNLLINLRHFKSVDKAWIYNGQWPDNYVVYLVDIHPISTPNPANIQYPIVQEDLIFASMKVRRMNKQVGW